MKNDNIKIGTLVTHNEIPYVVIYFIDIHTALCKNLNTNTIEQIKVSEFKIQSSQTQLDIMSIEDTTWEKAIEEFNIIKPLLNKLKRTREQVTQQSTKHNLSAATLYRWIQDYETNGVVTALLRKSRADKGSQRISEQTLKIVDDEIGKSYLNNQKISISNLAVKIMLSCEEKGVQKPSYASIRRRINMLPDEILLEKRLGKNKALSAQPIKSAFPGAEWPLSLIQIDHTKLDIMLVDDVHRQSIGRPNLTLAIDVFSRMITGYYLSFDPPSFVSVGMCIANSILPKDKILAKFEIDAEWPTNGLMDIIHVDNGKDFRSNALKRACENYRINIQWRPVRTPHYGGHIERLIGTINKELHNLPGTTFSDTKLRENYDSEKNAAMTISEFEKWLVTFIVKIYHSRVHSSIKCSPLSKYKEGILGNGSVLGRGIPAPLKDSHRLFIDFLPYYERTIQPYGVQIHNINYYHEAMRRWINAKDENSNKVKRKFLFKYDPRDISKVFFYDPDIFDYIAIPYRDITHPSMSIWELRSIERLLKEKNVAINENQIFIGYKELDEITKQSVKFSKQARRKNQQRLEHNKSKLEQDVIPQLSTKNKIIEDSDISNNESQENNTVDTQQRVKKYLAVDE